MKITIRQDVEKLEKNTGSKSDPSESVRGALSTYFWSNKSACFGFLEINSEDIRRVNS